MRVLLLAVGAVALLLSGLDSVAGQPQVPANFYGSVSVDGKPVPDGTEVLAFIDGKDCTQRGPSFRGTITIDGVSAYSIAVVHESQLPGCGAPGKTVTFTIGGRPAIQTATWQFGPQQVDLSAGTGDPVQLPTSTPTPPVTATPTSPPGAPPTDDVAPPEFNESRERTETPLGAVVPSEREHTGGRGAVWPWVAGGIVVVLTAASVAGWAIARRNQ